MAWWSPYAMLPRAKAFLEDILNSDEDFDSFARDIARCQGRVYTVSPESRMDFMRWIDQHLAEAERRCNEMEAPDAQAYVHAAQAIRDHPEGQTEPQLDALDAPVRSAYRLLLRWASAGSVSDALPTTSPCQAAFALMARLGKRYRRPALPKADHVIVDTHYCLETLATHENGSFYLPNDLFMMMAGAADVLLESPDDFSAEKIAAVERVIRPHQQLIVDKMATQGEKSFVFFSMVQHLSRAISSDRAAAVPPSGLGTAPAPAPAPVPASAPVSDSQAAFNSLISRVQAGEDAEDFILQAASVCEWGDLSSVNIKDLKTLNPVAARGYAVEAVRDLLNRELECGASPPDFVPENDSIVGIVKSVGDLVARARTMAKSKHSASSDAGAAASSGAGRGSLRETVLTSTDAAKNLLPVGKPDTLEDLDVIGNKSFIDTLPAAQPIPGDLKSLSDRILELQSKVVSVEAHRLMRKSLPLKIGKTPEGEPLARARAELARLINSHIELTSKSHFALSDGILLSSSNMVGFLSGVIWYSPPVGAALSQSFDFGPQLFWPTGADYPPSSTRNFLWAFEKPFAHTFWWDTLRFYAEQFTIANPQSHMKEWVEQLYFDYRSRRIAQLTSLQQAFVDDLGLKVLVFSKLQYSAIYGSSGSLPNFLTLDNTPEFSQFTAQKLELMSAGVSERLSPLHRVPILGSDADRTAAARRSKPMPLTIATAYGSEPFVPVAPSPRDLRSPFSPSSALAGRDSSLSGRTSKPTRADTPGSTNPVFAGLVKEVLLKDKTILIKEDSRLWTKWPALRGLCRKGVACKQGCEYPQCGFCDRFAATMASLEMQDLERDLIGYFDCSAEELTLPGRVRKRERSTPFDAAAKSDDGRSSATKLHDGKRPPSRDGAKSPGGQGKQRKP